MMYHVRVNLLLQSVTAIKPAITLDTVVATIVATVYSHTGIIV